MILRSRKWRLIFRGLALVITSVLMLAFAGPASYALQDDTPRAISNPRQLLDEKGKPRTDIYVNARGVPDLQRAFVTREGDNTYYWIPLTGYGNSIVVRTEDPRYVVPHDALSRTYTPGMTNYAGKVALLNNQPEHEEIVEELEKRAIAADKDETLVLLQGEAPSTYRPVVPVIPVLAWVWGAALLGLVQIWRGRRRPRMYRQARAA